LFSAAAGNAASERGGLQHPQCQKRLLKNGLMKVAGLETFAKREENLKALVDFLHQPSN
jgi:hypothetical protein